MVSHGISPASRTSCFRAGGGIYYDRFQGNRIFDSVTNPPETVSPTLNQNFVSTINPKNVLLGPPDLAAADPTGKIPTTYNYQFERAGSPALEHDARYGLCRLPSHATCRITGTSTGTRSANASSPRIRIRNWSPPIPTRCSETIVSAPTS